MLTRLRKTLARLQGDPATPTSNNDLKLAIYDIMADYEADVAAALAIAEAYTDAAILLVELQVDQYPSVGGNTGIGLLTVDGSGLIFTTSKPYKKGKMIVVRSGQTKSQGNVTGYSETTNQSFTITSPLDVDETLLAFYIP